MLTVLLTLFNHYKIQRLPTDYPDLDNYFYAVVVSFLVIVMFLFAVDAVLQENTPSLLAFYFLALVLVGRLFFAVIFNLVTLENDVLRVKWEYLFSFVMTVIFSIIYIVLIYPLYKSFGLVAVEFIGIEKNLIRIYKIYKVFITIIILDAVIVFLLSVMVFFYNWKFYLDHIYSVYYVYPLVAIYVVLTFIFLPFVGIFTKREWWPLLIGWLMFGSIMVFFAIFVIVQNIFFERSSPPQKKIFVTVLAFFFIIWKLLVLIMTIITMLGFRQGLKDKFYPPQDHDDTPRNREMKQSNSAFD
eukprot:gene850-9099_t